VKVSLVALILFRKPGSHTGRSGVFGHFAPSMSRESSDISRLMGRKDSIVTCRARGQAKRRQRFSSRNFQGGSLSVTTPPISSLTHDRSKVGTSSVNTQVLLRSGLDSPSDELTGQFDCREGQPIARTFTQTPKPQPYIFLPSFYDEISRWHQYYVALYRQLIYYALTFGSLSEPSKILTVFVIATFGNPR
jgi:hypothetical protein